MRRGVKEHRLSTFGAGLLAIAVILMLVLGGLVAAFTWLTRADRDR